MDDSDQETFKNYTSQEKWDIMLLIIW